MTLLPALPDVTLVAIDTVAHELTRLALQDCIARANFAEVLIFSDRPDFYLSCCGPFEDTVVAVVLTEALRGWEAVNRVWWYELPRYVRTSHCLMVQWDSWVINPAAWEPDWLQYDYIGALWPWHPTSRVGNGGFSLRSLRLMERLARYPELYPVDHPEDDTLCRRYRPMLEAEGFRWAPDAAAVRFSFERGNGSVYRAGGPIGTPPFGFHGAFNFPAVLTPEALDQRIAAANDYAKGKLEWREMLQQRREVSGHRSPCGECHLRPGEICDICGAVAPCCASVTL
jgi:hypothetical protein